MAFKTTSWEGSDDVDGTMIDVKPGLQYLSIIGAKYDEESSEYDITVKSLTNGAIFTLRYWRNTRDEGGAVVPNDRNRGTLISLGKALAGEPIGTPNTSDIIGGVVMADVTLSKPDAKGNVWPRVYTFKPVPEPIAMSYATIEQYSVPENQTQ